MEQQPVFPVKGIVIVCIVYTLCLIAVLAAINRFSKPAEEPPSQAQQVAPARRG